MIPQVFFKNQVELKNIQLSTTFETETEEGEGEGKKRERKKNVCEHKKKI